MTRNSKKKISSWSSEKRMLARAFLGLVGRPTRVLDIEREMEGEIGYTSKNGNIHLAEKHEIMNDLNEVERVSFRRGVFAHETLHQIYTDFVAFERRLNTYRPAEKQIFATLMNVLEDAAIENYAPEVMGGTMLTSLRFSISHIYRWSPNLEKSESPYSQFINALIQFGDMGLLKGRFTFPEVRPIFLKVAPIFAKGIETPSATERLKLAAEIMKISKPLWEQMVKDAEELKKFLEEMKKNGISPMQGKSKGRSAEGSGSGGKASERRKVTITKVTKEELEEMKKNGEISENSSGEGGGACDGVMCDEEEGPSGGSSSGAGVPAGSSGKSKEKSKKKTAGGSSEDIDVEVKESDAYKKQKKTKKASEKSDESESSKGNGENGEESSSSEKEGSEKEGDSSSNEGNSESNEKSQSKSSSDAKRDANDSTDNEFAPHLHTDEVSFNGNVATPEGFEESDEANKIGEIEEEEYSLTEADINAIIDEMKLAEEEYEKEQEKENRVPEIQDFPVTSPKLGRKTCLNHRMTYSERDVEDLETAYGKVLEKLNSGINTLTTQLKRIFENDVEETEYRSSGRINTKRVYSGRVTARVFDRRIAPTGKSNFSVELLVDESGSMSGYGKDTSARYACIALAEVFSNLRIPTYIVGFTADCKGYDIVHNHYLTWKNTHNERLKLLNISARANNCDGYSIRYATEVLKKAKSENKLLIVLSDGQPAAHGYYNGVSDTKQAIRDAKKYASVLGVAIGNSDTETIHYMYEKDFLHISNVEDLFSGLSRQMQKLMKNWGAN